MYLMDVFEMWTVFIYVVFTSIVLTVNVLLLLLIVRHTPKSFANIVIVMKVHVVSDIVTILAGATVMNRVVPIGHSFVYIAYGPCTWMGSSACFFSFAIFAQGGFMTLYLVLVSFIVRLRIMRNERLSDGKVIVLMLLIAFPVPISIIILLYSSRSDGDTLLRILQEHLSQYAARNATIYGIADIRTPRLFAVFSLLIFSTVPLNLVILYLRSQTLNRVKGALLSDKTKYMQSQCVKMLTLQIAVPPIVFIITMIPFELEHNDIVRHPILEVMINIVGGMSTLLNPLIVLSHIAPYRKEFMRLVSVNRPASEQESTVLMETTNE